jgi:ankyrin repeat protein
MGDELLWAVKNGDLSTIRQHIDKPGFDVNATSMNGRNALHYAADYGQVEVVQLLLEKKANIDLPDKFGITPLLTAIYEGHVEVVDLLLKKV